MDWDSKIDGIRETLSERYFREGLKTRFYKPTFVDKNYYDLSLDILKNTDFLGEISFGLGFSKRICFLYNVEVQDSVRNQGYGSKIIFGLEDTLRDFNFEEVHVVTKNKNVENFWKKCGYNSLPRNMIKFL